MANKEKVLRLLVSNPMPFGGIDFDKEYEETINNALKEGHLVCCLSYLHGIVESAAGYDICVCINGEIFATLAENDNLITKDGKYDATLHGYDGELKAYIWNVPGFKLQRALIVDVADEEAVAYAERCFKDKEENL